MSLILREIDQAIFSNGVLRSSYCRTRCGIQVTCGLGIGSQFRLIRNQCILRCLQAACRSFGCSFSVCRRLLKRLVCRCRTLRSSHRRIGCGMQPIRSLHIGSKLILIGSQCVLRCLQAACRSFDSSLGFCLCLLNRLIRYYRLGSSICSLIRSNMSTVGSSLGVRDSFLQGSHIAIVYIMVILTVFIVFIVVVVLAAVVMVIAIITVIALIVIIMVRLKCSIQGRLRFSKLGICSSSDCSSIRSSPCSTFHLVFSRIFLCFYCFSNSGSLVVCRGEGSNCSLICTYCLLIGCHSGIGLGSCGYSRISSGIRTIHQSCSRIFLPL